MSLTRLLIRDFRNIETADLVLPPGFNLLIGTNGSGKTSVLEAIYALGHGRVSRSSQISRAIHHEQETFVFHGRLQGEKREIAIGLTKDKRGGSKVHISGTDGYKAAELVHLVPMQLITLKGFTLLSDSSKCRRAFPGQGCLHNELELFTAWSNFKRLLKQRNVALHQVTCYEQLRPWDKELIPLVEQISTWHAEYSADITAGMADACKQFLPESSLISSFQRGQEKETEYAEAPERSFEHDRQLTCAARDPHRADLHIRADDAPMEGTLSRGQFKLLMCALRLAQREFLTHKSGRRCLYLIGDSASELDDECRGLLISRLKAAQSQAFVNAINVRHVINMSDENSKTFIVEEGKITG